MSVKYHINISKGINVNDIKKVEVFGHGFFQDILNFMKHLNVKHITDKEATAYRDFLLKPYTPIKKDKRRRGRRQWGTPIPGARPIGIKLKGEPCKECKDKGDKNGKT